MAFEPIENYDVIGSMRSIALVGMNGSIDFPYYPDFDSPTVFAARLDDENGGTLCNSAAAVQHARAATLLNSTEHCRVTKMQRVIRSFRSRTGLLGSFETTPQFSERESLCNLE